MSDGDKCFRVKCKLTGLLGVNPFCYTPITSKRAELLFFNKQFCFEIMAFGDLYFTTEPWLFGTSLQKISRIKKLYHLRRWVTAHAPCSSVTVAAPSLSVPIVHSGANCGGKSVRTAQ